ncbi:DUF308 domain-containing protein [Streptomyces sp. NPDC002755]|uniref:DUF308 domain-containing protein n=1 Tax=Streptomyces sp. NPDC002884 TaxID=3154544 RepID=UPI0033246C66
MDTLVSTSSAASKSTPLRMLYLGRFVFAAVWAGLLFTSADRLGALNVTLLLVYPAVDMAAVLFDVRAAQANGGAVPALYTNAGISALAVVSLAFAAASGIPAVLRVWGAWAIVSGVLQLITGVVRRRGGGQWSMIISGTISTLAGTSFITQAGSDDVTLKNLAGYAFLGGAFFLVSALRLNRGTRQQA